MKLRNLLSGKAHRAIRFAAFCVLSVHAYAAQTATPVITVSASGSQRSVTITAQTGATIYYTIDGSKPTTASTVYSGSAFIDSSTNGAATNIISAIATSPGNTTSAIATETVSVPGWHDYSQVFPLPSDLAQDPGVIDVLSNAAVAADVQNGTDVACDLNALFSSNLSLEDPGKLWGTAYWQDKIFYFPNGTYKLSNPACLPLLKNYYNDGVQAYGMVLIGESRSGVRLVLQQNVLPVISFTGSTVKGSPIITVSGSPALRANQLVKFAAGGSPVSSDAAISGVSGNTVTLYQNATATANGVSFIALSPVVRMQSINKTGNEGFHNTIENMTLDLTSGGLAASGNKGAVGISFLANNFGAIRHVAIQGDTETGTKGTGIDMTGQVIGPAVIENVAISGFDRGIDVANTQYGITLEDITFANQYSGAIFNTDNLITANAIDFQNPTITPSAQYRNITNSSTATANPPNAQGDSFVILANSLIEQTGTTLFTNNAGVLTLLNTKVPTAQSNINIPSGIVNGTVVGPGSSAFTSGSNLKLDPLYDTPNPAYDPATAWEPVATGMSASWINQIKTVSSAVVLSNYTDYSDSNSPPAPASADTAIATAISNAGKLCSSTTTSTLYFPHGVYYITHPIVIPSYIDRIVGMDSTIAIMPNSTNYPSTGGDGSAIFQVGNDPVTTCAAANVLTIERLAFYVPSSSKVPETIYAVEADAALLPGAHSQVLVLRDLFHSGVSMLNQLPSGGEVYLDNTGGPILLDGPNQVMARQYNTEAGPSVQPDQISVTSIAATSGVATYTVASPDTVLAAGHWVSVSNLPSPYNVDNQPIISTPTSTSFTVKLPGSTATLAITSVVSDKAIATVTESYGGPFITNNGAPLWILGFKTEGQPAYLNSTNSYNRSSLINEFVGGYFFTAPGGVPTAPATTCADEYNFFDSNAAKTAAMFQLSGGSQLESLFIEEATPSGGQVDPTTGNVSTAYATFPYYKYSPTTCTLGAGQSGTHTYTFYNRTVTPSFGQESGSIVPLLDAQ